MGNVKTSRIDARVINQNLTANTITQVTTDPTIWAEDVQFLADPENAGIIEVFEAADTTNQPADITSDGALIRLAPGGVAPHPLSQVMRDIGREVQLARYWVLARTVDGKVKILRPVYADS